VDVGGRQVRLTSLDRVLYPATGTTKAEVVDYYARIAPVLLTQLQDRPVSRVRWPRGVGAEKFFEKNVPAGAPSWVRRQTLLAEPEDPGSTVIEFPFLDDVASLVWSANLSALELHTPQWSVGPRGGYRGVDRLVVDLDPGEGAGLGRVRGGGAPGRRQARRRRAEHRAGDLGQQGHAAVRAVARPAGPGPRQHARLRQGLRRAARPPAPGPRGVRHEEGAAPRQGARDWSQNHLAKTTVTPYSLRGRELPRVAAPRSWDEVGDGMQQLSPAEVLQRVETDGDLMDALTA
jgi:bifunctional non-homologous end joining protein LigD